MFKKRKELETYIEDYETSVNEEKNVNLYALSTLQNLYKIIQELNQNHYLSPAVSTGGLIILLDTLLNTQTRQSVL